jgi:hypothetical protein
MQVAVFDTTALRDRIGRALGFTTEVVGFLLGSARMMEDGAAQQAGARASLASQGEAAAQRRYHESPPTTV